MNPQRQECSILLCCFPFSPFVFDYYYYFLVYRLLWLFVFHVFCFVRFVAFGSPFLEVMSVDDAGLELGTQQKQLAR